MSKKRKLKSILHKIYARIPETNCKGLCQESCSMIGFTRLEEQVMTQASGQKPFLTNDAVCGYLVDSRCSVYESRPAICRLFGSTEKLKCEHNCNSDRVLTEPQSHAILGEIDTLSPNGGMRTNISKLQAVNMRLGNKLDAPLSNMKKEPISSIVPFKKTD